MKIKRATMSENYKRIILISQHTDGHDCITWYDDEKELIWTVENNKALTHIVAYNFTTNEALYFEND